MANLKEEAVWTCLIAMYFGGSVNGTVGKHFALTFLFGLMHFCYGDTPLLPHPLHKSGLLPEVVCPSYRRKQEGARQDSVYRPLVGILFVFWSLYIFNVLYKKKKVSLSSRSKSTNIVSYVFFILLPFALKVHGCLRVEQKYCT